MTARPTSIACYRQLEADGTLHGQCYDIMICLHTHNLKRDWSISELCQQFTGTPLAQKSTMSGRLNDLKTKFDVKYIVESEQRHCYITKKLITPIRLNVPQQMSLLAA